MPHDRYSRVNYPGYNLRYLFSAFQFHCLRAPLLHQPGGVGQSLGCVQLVGHERQVCCDHGALGPPGRRLDVVHHVIHGHRNS